MSNYNYYGFETLGKRTTDFGLMCVEHIVGFPTKNKILIDVPFSNKIYDFSNIYGGQVFTNRTLKFKFLFNQTGKDGLYRIWTQVANWLMQGNEKLPLYDDRMRDYYYLAEVTEIQDFEEAYSEGYLTIELDCYPFRIYELNEGNDIWDSFDFELDIAQNISFEVNGTKSVVLFNTGTPSIKPTIKASSEMKLVKNNTQLVIPAGTSSLPRFSLEVGENRFSLIGNGTIEFIWHKELV